MQDAGPCSALGGGPLRGDSPRRGRGRGAHLLVTLAALHLAAEMDPASRPLPPVGTVLPGPPHRNRALSSAHRKIALNKSRRALRCRPDDPSGGPPATPTRPSFGPAGSLPPSPRLLLVSTATLPLPASLVVRGTRGRALRTLLCAGCQARPSTLYRPGPGEYSQAHGAPRGLLGKAARRETPSLALLSS